MNDALTTSLVAMAVYMLAVELWARANGYSIVCEDGVGFLIYDSAGAFVGKL